MTNEDGDTGCGAAPPHRFGQRPDVIVPGDFDELPTPGKNEAWEAPDPASQDDSDASQDLDDDWPIDAADLHESLLEAEADLAAGRTVNEGEIRARYGLPRPSKG
ncbi:hypothetical protein H7I77_00115 [Mycolicibacterium novocastrense]|uniref:Uncharacterized protein n=1 Tax=Mycolicibacterium novocastrense TaxID=59813 RepID=A0AAW5SDN1_MYCNV|nr:hypothetical protein [Mycolicibacterium novocastrense]MCV7021765.1 hypothetical protein [Mycolicibacterium novocastrense]GAT11688.1 uncharacterized protein RMCN_4821 [Mycolicibacterium novocastrense]